jgi:hypothetical protein
MVVLDSSPQPEAVYRVLLHRTTRKQRTADLVPGRASIPFTILNDGPPGLPNKPPLRTERHSANAASDTQLLVAGFILIFFIQVAGNSMQIFPSEVFPTNARASGVGWAAGVGRLATAGIVPLILWIQTGYALTTVFVCLAIVLLIAAASVTQLGPEARQKGLDEIAPPTGSWPSPVLEVTAALPAWPASLIRGCDGFRRQKSYIGRAERR